MTKAILTRTLHNHTIGYRNREEDMRIIIEENKIKEKLRLTEKDQRFEMRGVDDSKVM